MIRRLAWLLGLAATLASLPGWSPCRAGSITINPGFDLLASPPYTTSLPNGGGATGTSVPIPLGTYDFGSGPVNVGTTNWLQERLTTITLPTVGSSDTAPLVFLVRQVISSTPIPYDQVVAGTPGMGYVAYAIDYASPATGSLTVTRTSDTGGTFTETVTSKYNYYEGGLNGPVFGSSPTPATVTITGTWQTTPPPGAIVIPGINNDDFYITSATGSGPHSPDIPLASASVPEPSSAILALIGIGLLAGFYWRRRGVGVA